MNRKIIIEEINRLKEVIYEQTAIITSYNENIPLIEIDILLDNIKQFYQCCKDLEKINSLPVQNTGPKTESTSVSETEKISEIEKTIIGETTNQIINNKEINLKTIESDIETYTEPSETAIMAEEQKSETENIQTKLSNAKKKSKTIHKNERDLFFEVNNQPIVADKYRDDTKSLNEIIAANKQDNTIASKMQQTPISDLKASIRINEKFLLLNELFDGDLQEYNLFIDKVNNKENLESAIKYINEMKLKKEWDESNESYIILMNLVSRRFL